MKDIEPYTAPEDPDVITHKEQGLGLIDYAIIPHADNAEYAGEVQKETDDFTERGFEVIALHDDQVVVHDGDERVVI